MAEVRVPDPVLPQPFQDEDWRAWVNRFLAWLRGVWPGLATKDYVRQQIADLVKEKGL